MITKLTVALVRRLTEEESPSAELWVWDSALPRFGLRVRKPAQSGKPWPSAYFVQWKRGAGGRMKVGAPATHSLEEARGEARKVLREADAGRDPHAARKALREEWTIGDAAAAFLCSPEFSRKPHKSQVADRSHLEKHIVPRLGRTRLSDIDAPAARRLLRAVEQDTRVNARKRRMGGPGAAKKAVRTLSALLSWAINEGRLASHPLKGALRLEGDAHRETVLESSEDYARLFAAMDSMVEAWHAEQDVLARDPAARSVKFHPTRRSGPAGPTQVVALRPASRVFITVAALTGMRRGEIQALRWGDIDLGARRITLRDTKGGKLARSGAKTETVSVPPVAAAALASIMPERPDPEENVFIPHRGTRYAINHDWVAVRREAQLPADLMLHGLRHSIGTHAAAAGMSALEVQRLLRHRNVSTSTRYIHLAEQMTGRLQDRATAHLVPEPDPASRDKSLEKPDSTVDVLPMRRSGR